MSQDSTKMPDTAQTELFSPAATKWADNLTFQHLIVHYVDQGKTGMEIHNS